MDAAVREHADAVARARTPLLLLTFEPGAIVGPAEVAWCKAQFPQLTVRALGRGIHFVQEDQPAAIGRALADWLARH